jgi:signal peptidase
MTSKTPNSIRATLTNTLPLLLTLCTPFMLWKTLSIITLSPVPIVCVISESMAPAFHRGDLLFLWNRPSCVEIGEVPVVWFKGNPLPMVHRAIRVHNVDCEGENASKR